MKRRSALGRCWKIGGKKANGTPITLNDQNVQNRGIELIMRGYGDGREAFQKAILGAVSKKVSHGLTFSRKLPCVRFDLTLFFAGKKRYSVAGNRTRVSWVKARYPNRWTTTDLQVNEFISKL